MLNDEWIRIRSELEAATSLSNLKKISTWMALDCPAPPPSAYKQELVKAYAQYYKITTLIETGTYLGDMVGATSDYFSDIHSIELGVDLHRNATKRFKDHKHVKLYQGDSGEVLGRLLKKLKKPAIFWLDAHYSEGITAKGKLNTPVIEEVQSILAHKIKNHVILIDDSRIFNGTDDYPTVSSLGKLFLKALPNATYIDRHDVIRIQPTDQHIDV